MFKNILVPINPLRDEEKYVINVVVSIAETYHATVKLIYLGSSSDYNFQMENCLEKFSNKGLKADFEFLKFSGVDEEIPGVIADFAQNFDLVIMGHKKFEKIYRFLHQSTAADLINMVTVPVMVVTDK